MRLASNISIDETCDGIATGLCDSGIGVSRPDENITTLPYDETLRSPSIVAYQNDDRYLSASESIQVNTKNLKRGPARAGLDQSEKPKKSKRSKELGRVKNHKANSNNGINGEEVRVGCPFFKKNPKAHAGTTGCRGKGFREMSKLKYVNATPPSGQTRLTIAKGPH